MSDAPERIWAEPGMPGYLDEPNELYTVEYVRADHIEELEAKLAKAEAKIMELEEYKWMNGRRNRMTEEQYDEAMYELDDMFLAGEIGYADYIKGFRDLNEKYREGETND